MSVMAAFTVSSPSSMIIFLQPGCTSFSGGNCGGWRVKRLGRRRRRRCRAVAQRRRPLLVPHLAQGAAQHLLLVLQAAHAPKPAPTAADGYAAPCAVLTV